MSRDRKEEIISRLMSLPSGASIPGGIAILARRITGRAIRGWKPLPRKKSLLQDKPLRA